MQQNGTIDRVQSWGRVARALHWGMALLIAVEVPAGFVMSRTYAQPGAAATWHYWAGNVHHSAGLTLLALALVRVIVRLVAPHPAPTGSSVERGVARGSHHLMYMLLLLIPLTGWAAVSSLQASAQFPQPALGVRDRRVRTRRAGAAYRTAGGVGQCHVLALRDLRRRASLAVDRRRRAAGASRRGGAAPSFLAARSGPAPHAEGHRMRRTLVALLICAAPVSAQDRVIRFGLTGDYPPYAERQPDGSVTGADVVMARRVAKALHARPVFVPTAWTTLSADLVAGRFDVAIGGLTITPDRAAIGTFSIRLLDDGKRPLARCAEAARYRSIAAIDQSGTRVEINRGPAIGALAKHWFRVAQVTVNPVDADLVLALLDRRADVWITDGAVVDHMARRYPGRLCATTRVPFTHQDKAWLIRSDPALVAAIDRQLRRAIDSGAWQRALEAVR